MYRTYHKINYLKLFNKSKKVYVVKKIKKDLLEIKHHTKYLHFIIKIDPTKTIVSFFLKKIRL